MSQRHGSVSPSPVYGRCIENAKRLTQKVCNHATLAARVAVAAAVAVAVAVAGVATQAAPALLIEP